MKKLGLFFTLLLILIIVSCEIGLGSSVDTEAPTISIENPPADAKIREAFMIDGNWSDDGAISKLSIELKSNDSKISAKHTFEGTLNYEVKSSGGKGTWYALIDPIKEGIKDGTYEATVTIVDSMGHKTSTNRSYTIDNTKPVIKIERPSSIKNAEDSLIESYGQYLTLTGEAYDDNDIATIKITFYDAEEDSGKGPWPTYLTGVSSKIDNDIAKFSKTFDVNNIYSQMYGNDPDGGTHKYYCTIETYDGTKRYPPKGQEKEDDDLGNPTNTYLLDDDLQEFNKENSALCEALKGKDQKFKVKDLYAIKAGNSNFTSDRAVSDEYLSEALEKINELFTNKSVSEGSLKLNPKNNPSFSVSGLELGEITNVENERALTVQLSKGLDGIKIDRDSLKVYLIPVMDPQGNTIENADKIYLSDDDAQYEKKGDGQFLATIRKKQDVNDPEKDLVYRTVYIIGVEGEDIEGNKMEASLDGSNKDYRIRLKAKNIPPELTITKPEDTIWYTKKGDSVVIEGTTSVPDGQPTLELRKNGSKDSIWTYTVSESDLATDSEDDWIKYNFSVTIPDDTTGFAFNEEKTDKYVFEIVSTLEESSSSASKTIVYDIDPPTIQNYSLTSAYDAGLKDGIKTYYIDNRETPFTLTGIAKDNIEVGEVSLTLKDENGTTLRQLTSTDAVWTFESNSETEAWTDLWKTWTDSVTAVISVKDKAGNITVSPKEFRIIFDTEAPVSKHCVDTSGKDLYFRIGEQSNDDIDSTSSLWDESLDKDVGGKYKSGTFGNKETIKIRGNFGDGTGSGVKMIYYKLFTHEPTTTEIQSFLKNYESQAITETGVGYFSPLAVPETKRIFYTDKSASGDLNDGTLGNTIVPAKKSDNSPDIQNGKFYTDIVSTYKTMITGFTAGYNHLALVAVDNVGHAAIDSVSSYCINVDTQAPETLSAEDVFTDGSADLKLAFTVNDKPDGQDAVSAGVNKVSVKMESVTETKSATLDTTLGSPTNGKWVVTIHVAELPSTSGSYAVSVTAVDGAGEGNSDTRTVCNVIVDKDPPEISNVKFEEVLTSSSKDVSQKNEYYYVNNTQRKQFRVSGVASDNRGVGSISLEVINTAENPATSLGKQKLDNPAQNWNFTVGDWSSWTTGATLVITATDKAGLTSSQTLNIAFDTVAPTVSTEENAIIVPNPSQSENSMFKFEGAAGSLSDAASGLDKVEIAFTSDNTEPTAAQATVTPSSNGSWSSTVEFANAAFGGVFNTQGTKYLWVKAYDKAGNASAWTPKSFKYDTAAPEVSFTDVTPAANSYRKEGFKLEVNASDSYGVDSVTVSYGTETTVPLTLNTETGKYEKSFRVDSEPGDAKHLDDGKYTFTVHVTDKSGKSSEAVRTFSIDTILPTGSFAENQAGTLADGKLWFKSSSVRFAVNVIDANIDTVEITKDGTIYDPMTLSSGSYSATLTELSEGENTITVKMKDHAGNENTTSTVIYVDTTEPSLNVNASSVLKYMGSGGFTVDGTVGDSGSGLATLTVTEEYSEDNVNFEATPASGAAVDFTGNNWIKHLPLGASTTPANGYYRYKFILKDKAGNSAEYSTNTTVDVDAPEIIISSPTDKTGPNAINASPYMFSGTVTEANEVMALYYKILNKDADAPSSPASDVLTKTTWTNAGWTSITAEKNWSFYRDINDGTNSIREGLYNIYMYVLDGAGNLSARASREFHVDMASPVVEITNAPANVNIVTNNDGSRKVVISGTVTESHELKSLTINGTSVSGIEFNTAVDNENWTYEDTPTEDGTYTYTIVATDKVEKTNTTLSKTIDVDITAPTIENLKINNKAIAENAWYKTQIIPLSVTADDVGTGISSVEYATLAASGTTPEESDWTSLPAYGNNIYSGSAIFKEIGENQKLFIRAKDKVGNIKNFNNGTAVTVNIDTTAPDVIPSSDNSFATNGVGTNSIIVTGTANDAESGLEKLTVTVIEKNVEFTQVITSFTGDGANKTWTATIPVSTFNEKESGMYTIYAQAVNNAELPSSKISVGTISVDTDSPNVTITSPEADAKVGEAGLIISGSADDGTGSGLSTELVKIYYNIDDPASAESWHELGSTSSGANWTFTKSQIPVAIGYPDSIADDGANTAVYFKISVKDKAGNIGYSEPRRIIIDRKKPTFDIGMVGGSTATDGWFNTRTINIAGNFEDIGGSGVTSIYYKIADSDSVVIPTTDGSYNRNITIPEDATNPITLNIWARDAAGNEISSTDSGYKAYTLNIDSTTPTLTANYFVKGSEEISIPKGTIYKKSGATTFTLYGNYQDDANGSGIKVLKFKNDGEDITPTITYSTNPITSAASATDASYATYNINSAKTYKSWKAVFSITEGGRITVEGEDIAGNKTTTLSALDIAVDNDAPAISNVKLNVTTGTNSNEVYSDGTYYYLNNTVSGKTFTITGLATDNVGVHKVNLSITNTATTNTATALTDSISNPNGSWSFEVDDWSDWETGATATVTVTDKAGNSATPVSLNIVFVITKPVVVSGQLKTPTPIQTESNLFKFEGLNESVTDSGTSSGFDKVEIAFTNAPVSGTPTDPSAAQATATLDANGSWSSTVEFANEAFSGVFNTQGTKYLWVRAYDNAGNVSDWTNKAFVYDTGTPTISFTNTTPVADSKRKEGFTLEVEANDSYGVKTVTVTYAEGMTPIELTEQSTGNLYSTSFRVGSETGSIPLLTDGDYTFTVIVEDNSGIEGARGKTNTVTRKITVDTTAPYIDMTSASVTRTADFSNWHKVNQIPVSVNVSDVSGVSSVQVSTDGTNFTEPSSLRLSGTSWIGSILCDKQGENKIYFKAIDAVGNETTVDLAYSISVYIDTEAPGTPVFLGAKTTGASTIPVSEITSVLVNKEKALTVYGAIIDSGDASNATGIPVSGTDIFRQKGKTSSESVSETFTSILAFTPVLEVNHTYSEGDVVKNIVGSQNKLYVCTTAHTTAGSEPFVAANWKDISEYSFWSYEIPTTDMSNGGINFTVKDNAGNKADYTLFQMTVDTLPPTVTVTPLSDADYDADGTQINGIISIIGNASDEDGLSTTEPMKLYYTTLSTLTANPTSGSTGNIGTTAASNWVEIGSIAHANSWSFNNIDTAKLDGTNTIADNTTVYFKVVAKDKAGNTKYSDRITAIVDQDTDRPIIKFTNLILNAMSSSVPLPFETNALYGSVTDDDGIAIDDNEKYQFYYQSANSDPTANDTNWIQIKLSNGTLFTLTLPDGKKNLYFKVVDTGKTSNSDSGTVFITSATDAYNQSTPKLTDSAVTPNTYGYRTSGVGKFRTVTYLKVDIKTPEAKDIRFTRTTSNTNSWNNAISDELFGGTHNIFHLQQLAFDENGVEKVYLSIPANAADGDLSGLGSDGVVNWINIDNATGITSTVYTNGAELIAGANYWITSDITQTSFGTITSVAENHASITIGSGNDAKVYTRKPVVVTSWVYTNEDTEETQTVYTNGNRPSENANYWNDNVITGVASGTISGVSSNYTEITIGTGNNAKTYIRSAYIFPLEDTEPNSNNKFHLWQTPADQPIDVTNFASVNRIASLVTFDGIRSSSNNVTVNIDNTPVTIKINGPANETQAGSVTVLGQINDRAEVYYAVSTSDSISPDSKTPVTTWKNANDVSATISELTGNYYKYKKISKDNAELSWSVSFDENGAPSTEAGEHQQILNKYLVSYGITTADQLNNYNELVKLYVWIKAVDERGNQAETVKEIVLDPQGDRPEVKFSYPTEDGKTYGGQVQLTGSANDKLGSSEAKKGVESLWLQIVSKKHQKKVENEYQTVSGTFGTFTYDDTSKEITSFNVTKDDLDFLKDKYDIYNMKTYHEESTHTKYSGTLGDGYVPSDYAIRITPEGSSWNTTINEQVDGKGEFDYKPALTDTEKTNGIALRLYAQDKDGKFSSPKYCYMIFDSQNPVVGNEQKLYLIHSSSDAITTTGSGATATPNFGATASKEYTKDMFVRGSWYLIGSVSDNDKIKQLKIGGKTLVTIAAADKDTITEQPVIATNTTDHYSTWVSTDKSVVYFKYKLNTAVGVGNLQFDIYAEDFASPTTGKTTQTMYVKYDNKSPDLVGADDSAYKLSPYVVQKNGFYRIESKVKEDGVIVQGSDQPVAQSGFDFVAFYFMRRNTVSTEVDTIYNPMLSSGNSDTVSASTKLMSASGISEGEIIYDSGLYWRKMTVERTNSLNTLNISSTENDKYIRKNGLVSIGGSLYKIIEKTTSSITINGNPPQNETTAYFALALLADHTTPETASTLRNSAGYPNTITGDDGDGFVDYVEESGTSYTWSAELVSKNIPDGPIELHYVAFDTAGNYSIGIMGNITEATYIGTTLAQTPDRKEYKDLYNAGDSRTSNILYVDGEKSYYNAASAGSEIAVATYKAAAFVQNNAPRIAALTIWTDYNGDNSAAGANNANETKVKYCQQLTDIAGNPINYAGGVTSTFIVSGNNKDYIAAEGETLTGTAYRTIRDTTTFTPEIVGGNNNLHYMGKVGKKGIGNDSLGKASYSTLTENWITVPANPQVNNEDYMNADQTYVDLTKTRSGEITISADNLKALGTNSDEAGNDPYWFEYKIWDSTEGTTPGTNSLSAVMRIALNVQYFDETPPWARIKPFYWNSRTENSVVWSGSGSNAEPLGHIELEDDVSDAIKTSLGETGENDILDPKVSGKIKVEGYAYDNIRLKELYAKFTDHKGLGSYTKIASYNGSWTGLSDADNGWSATVEDVYSDETGHKAHWTLIIDTSKVTEGTEGQPGPAVVGKNRTVTVFAVDARGTPEDTTTISDTTIKGNTSVSDITNAVQTTETAQTPLYQMDVVPYITGVETKLSSLKKNNPSVYDRTALGHYPVSDTETVTFSGFNLAGAQYQKVAPKPAEGDNPAVEEVVDDLTGENVNELAVSNILASGKIVLRVGNLYTINNMNNNDAKGRYSETVDLTTNPAGDKSVYENYYNRMPNGDNNNLLTDDVEFDVWQINSEAGKPTNGPLTQPVMAINPKNKQVGFAFTNGPLYFSMGSLDKSYGKWKYGIDFWTSIGFAYDANGNSYGTAAGGDINGNTDADPFGIFSSKWGNGGITKDAKWHNQSDGWLRLESIGQGEATDAEGKTFTGDNINKERIKSSSIATTVIDTTSTNVYLAYYDELNNEIRFKYGKVTTTKGNDGLLADYYGPNGSLRNTKSVQALPYTLEYTSLIAGQTSGKKTFYYDNKGKQQYLSVNTAVMTDEETPHPVCAGQYVSIAAKYQGGDTYNRGTEANPDIFKDDLVVAVWYDATNNQMLYSYNTAPHKIKTLTFKDADRTIDSYSQSATGWSTPKAIFGEGNGIGEYCKVAIDGACKVPIACYDNANADVWYAYLDSYANPVAAKKCIVDSYGIVGTELNIDVALKDNKPVPYISYYGSSCARPKVAYWAGDESIATASTLEGAEDEAFTKSWEVSIIPSSSKISIDHINVGVWKDTSGNLTYSTTDGNAPNNIEPGEEDANRGVSEAGNEEGMIYGNGTKNPILGYAITKAASGFIETAQMK